jgi:hypothetical protein
MSLHVENVVVDAGVVPDGHGAGAVVTSFPREKLR